MPTDSPILAGSVEARDGGNVYVYGPGALGRDPQTGEFFVLAGHDAGSELVHRLHPVAAVELVAVEAIAVGGLLLTGDLQEES
jgi:hypothetical protein